MVTVIGDRESDIYSAWSQFPEGRFHLLSRSMQDRAVVGGGSLDATVAAFPVASCRSLELVERAGRPVRRPQLGLPLSQGPVTPAQRTGTHLPKRRSLPARAIHPHEPS